MAEQDVQIEEKILTTLQAILAYLQNTKTPPPPELQTIAQALQTMQQTLVAMQLTLEAQSTTLGLMKNQLAVVVKDLEPTPIAAVVVTTQIN